MGQAPSRKPKQSAALVSDCLPAPTLLQPPPPPAAHVPVSMTGDATHRIAICPCGWRYRERRIGGPQMSPSLQALRVEAGKRMDAAIAEHWRQEAFKAQFLKLAEA